MGLADGQAWEREHGVPANPKKQFGDKKPRLTLAPMTATLKQVEAQLDGALKYGEVNWRLNAVEAKTYIDAAMRHLRLYENGEELARDTQVYNLGGVMACCAILIDAQAHGMLIDNRDHSPQTCDALHEAEAMVMHLKNTQEAREAAKAILRQDQQFQNVPDMQIVCTPLYGPAVPQPYYHSATGE